MGGYGAPAPGVRRGVLLATVGMWAGRDAFWLDPRRDRGVANLIPMFGAGSGHPGHSGQPGDEAPAFLLVVLAVVALAHVVDGYVLSPIVLRETTNLHPVVVLLAVLVGADLYGFWGVLAAIPVAGIVQLTLVGWVMPRFLASGSEPVGARAGPA